MPKRINGYNVNRSVTVLQKCSNRAHTSFEKLNLYFLCCDLIIDACITKTSQKTRRGMARLIAEERGRTVGMVSAECSSSEVRKYVNNCTITGDIC